MNNPAISVIVPIYNVEKYIRRCIDSILSQTFTNFELLLIDDGSNDKSGEICDEYALHDNRIRVFHKENNGVGSARQLGVNEAKGDFSIHVDGDDWIETNMLEEMLNKIEQSASDILITDYLEDRHLTSSYRGQTICGTSSIEVLEGILQGKLLGVLWNKLIRHTLYKKYDIKFIPGIDYCEDVLVLAQLLQERVTVSFLHNAYYHYDHQYTFSITRNYTAKTYLAQKKFLDKLSEILPSKLKHLTLCTALRFKAEAFSHNILPSEDFYNYYPASLRAILRANISRSKKICFLIAYFKMFNFAKWLYNKYHRNNN